MSIVCLGPSTNVALAIKTFPEIQENIGEVFIMGGGFKRIGNVVPGAEFNLFRDPEAAWIMLNSKIPSINLVPLDFTLYINVTMVRKLIWSFVIFKNQ